MTITITITIAIITVISADNAAKWLLRANNNSKNSEFLWQCQEGGTKWTKIKSNKKMLKYKNEKQNWRKKEKSQAQPQLPRNGSGNCFVRGNCMKLVCVRISLPLCVCVCVLFYCVSACGFSLLPSCELCALFCVYVCVPQLLHCHAIKHLWHLTKSPWLACLHIPTHTHSQIHTHTH